MRAALILLASLLASPAAAQEIVSAAPEKVAIVVYPGANPGAGGNLFSGLAMVTEQRTVTLPAGPARISFRNVAEGIVAQTVAVQGLPDKVKEQNFDYRLLTPGSLLRQSLDRTVTVVRTNPATGKLESQRARVVSSGQGVMLDFEGRLEALDCAALPEKVVFDDLPGGLIDKPTLSLQTVSPRAGRYRLTLSYLATGVTWSAAYVARINPKTQTLDLSAWVTLANFSSSSFAQAPVQILAGRLERSGQTRPVQAQVDRKLDQCWPIISGRRQPQGFNARDAEVEEVVVTGQLMKRESRVFAAAQAPAPPRAAPPPPEDLGDYKLYSLPEPTTLAAHQVKQLALFDRPGVAYERVFRFDQSSFFGGTAAPRLGQSVILLNNDKKSGLGLAIPAGQMAVMEPGPTGQLLFVGSDRVRNTAEDLPIEITVGEASDVQAATVVTARSSRLTPGGKTATVDIQVLLTNAKAEPVVVQVREVTDFIGFKVSAETQPHRLKDGKAEWRVSLPPHGEIMLTYTLDRTG